MNVAINMLSFQYPFQFFQSNWLVSDAYRRPQLRLSKLPYSTYPSIVPSFSHGGFSNDSLPYQECAFRWLSDFQSQSGDDKNHWNETQDGQLPLAFPSGDE